MGKQRMQQRIKEQQLRIEALEQQVSLLRSVIVELTPERSDPPGGEAVASPAPVIFDLFEDGTTANVGIQTDISVNHWQPDLFLLQLLTFQLLVTQLRGDHHMLPWNLYTQFQTGKLEISIFKPSQTQ